MFKNKKSEFWFWFLLCCINIFTLMVVNSSEDDFTCILSGCMLILSFTKALTCALEIDNSK